MVSAELILIHIILIAQALVITPNSQFIIIIQVDAGLTRGVSLPFVFLSYFSNNRIVSHSMVAGLMHRMPLGATDAHVYCPELN